MIQIRRPAHLALTLALSAAPLPVLAQALQNPGTATIEAHVVKAAPLGGVRRALDIIRQAGLPAVVSSALDTSVGIRSGVALAAALPDLPFACGLATVSLMEGDVTDASLVPEGGRLPVRDVDVREERLLRFAADGDRRSWWLERLARTHAVLAARDRRSAAGDTE